MRDDEIQILIKFGQHPNIITVKVKILIRCITGGGMPESDGNPIAESDKFFLPL